MIGQKRLISQIDKIMQGGFPRFTIICGAPQSGKKLIAKYIVNQLGAQYVPCGIKVDEIRDTINLAYKQSEPMVYVIAGADKMSPAAKNALLKVTEEPPRKAYFIITITDMNNTLETLKSRGCVLQMDSYTPNEIEEYIKLKGYALTPAETAVICDICFTTGMVDTLVNYDVSAFNSFVSLVVDNIATVSGVNAFKINSRFKYKDTDEGWEPAIFMRVLMHEYCNRMIADPNPIWYESCRIVSKYLSQLNTTGINKSSTIDMMILELRGVQQ